MITKEDCRREKKGQRSIDHKGARSRRWSDVKLWIKRSDAELADPIPHDRASDLRVSEWHILIIRALKSEQRRGGCKSNQIFHSCPTVTVCCIALDFWRPSAQAYASYLGIEPPYSPTPSRTTIPYGLSSGSQQPYSSRSSVAFPPPSVHLNAGNHLYARDAFGSSDFSESNEVSGVFSQDIPRPDACFGTFSSILVEPHII